MLIWSSAHQRERLFSSDQHANKPIKFSFGTNQPIKPFVMVCYFLLGSFPAERLLMGLWGVCVFVLKLQLMLRCNIFILKGSIMKIKIQQCHLSQVDELELIIMTSGAGVWPVYCSVCQQWRLCFVSKHTWHQCHQTVIRDRKVALPWWPVR